MRATDTLPPQGDAAESHDLLHVPTPWHGCIVEIAGHENLYMTKVEKVEEAIEKKEIMAAWVAPTPQKNQKSPKKQSEPAKKKTGSKSDDKGDGASADLGAPLAAPPVPGAAFFTVTPTAVTT